MGQAAGIAAHLALAERTQPRSISTESLRRQLLADGQVLSSHKTTTYDELNTHDLLASR